LEADIFVSGLVLEVSSGQAFLALSSSRVKSNCRPAALRQAAERRHAAPFAAA
jgi:hypothetical protein